MMCCICTYALVLSVANDAIIQRRRRRHCRYYDKVKVHDKVKVSLITCLINYE